MTAHERKEPGDVLLDAVLKAISPMSAWSMAYMSALSHERECWSAWRYPLHYDGATQDQRDFQEAQRVLAEKRWKEARAQARGLYRERPAFVDRPLTWFRDFERREVDDGNDAAD